MIKNFKLIISLLHASEMKQVKLLVFLMVLVALLDAAGVASIMPFIALLTNADVIQTNEYLKATYDFINPDSHNSFMLVFGIIVFFVLVMSNIVKSISTFLLLRFIYLQEYKVSAHLATIYLRQPYEWFLNRSSSDIGKNLLSEVGNVISNALLPLMQIIASSLVIITILLFLIWVEPTASLVVGFCFTIAYVLLYKAIKNHLQNIGLKRLEENERRYAAISEIFGGIKPLKLSGFERAFLDKYAVPAKGYATHHSAASIISQLPRFFFEVLAFGGLMLILLIGLYNGVGVENILPVVSVFAFAGYRLMPAMQHIYGSVAQVQFAMPAVITLNSELKMKNTDYSKDFEKLDRLPLKTYLEFENVTFKYANTSKNSLEKINFRLESNTTNVIVGPTGSGKTSILDIALGLLEPQSGNLKVNGLPLDRSTSRRWRKSIGYVPQDIFLIDDTIKKNIAFGIPANSIDMKRVEKAAHMACLHDWVLNETENKYSTIVGERGARLSGGQRQRIGIARALYHEPEILIMDEATNSLDSLTEKAVMAAVATLSGKVTILMVSHRLDIAKDCDQVIMVDAGSIVATGTYAEVQEKSTKFNKMTANS